jgi:hypothetical protein
VPSPPTRIAALLVLPLTFGVLSNSSAVHASALPAAPVASLPVLPPANVGFDYQLGGAYPPAASVRIVARDRTERPVPGLYNVCYVNGFQTQPDAIAWWKAHHPRLLLRTRTGRLVVDSDWGEVLLDTSTATKRRRLTAIVGRWIDGCRARGFLAVEPDNLDSWTRSRERLTRADNVAFARLLTRRAHAVGLAIGQKNASSLAPIGPSLGFDFAIVEECQVYAECGAFTRSYGARVYEIEYVDNGGRANFDRACAARGARISISYRDRDLAPRGTPGYVNARC